MKRLPTSLSVKALASDAKLTALECVFNANSVAKYTQIWASCNAPWGSSVIQGPGGLLSAALCGPAPPPQKKVEAEASGPLSSPCPPLISEVLEWRSSFGSGGMCVCMCVGDWVSLVAKRTPYGQLTGVTGGPGQFPEFT